MPRCLGVSCSSTQVLLCRHIAIIQSVSSASCGTIRGSAGGARAGPAGPLTNQRLQLVGLLLQLTHPLRLQGQVPAQFRDLAFDLTKSDAAARRSVAQTAPRGPSGTRTRDHGPNDGASSCRPSQAPVAMKSSVKAMRARLASARLVAAFRTCHARHRPAEASSSRRTRGTALTSGRDAGSGAINTSCEPRSRSRAMHEQ